VADDSNQQRKLNFRAAVEDIKALIAQMDSTSGLTTSGNIIDSSVDS
jgi:hypothetical protein